jgi:hypothetical protein
MILAGAFLACSSVKEDEKLLKEAAVVHNSAVALAAQLESDLERLKRDTTIVQDSLHVLENALEVWEETLVEVPGNDEHHHEGHDHHHDHGHTQTGLTAGQMLVVQQELKRNLQTIETRLNALKRR